METYLIIDHDYKILFKIQTDLKRNWWLIEYPLVSVCTHRSMYCKEKTGRPRVSIQNCQVSSWSPLGWHWAYFSSSDWEIIAEKQNGKKKNERLQKGDREKKLPCGKQTLIETKEYKTIFSLKYKWGHLPRSRAWVTETFLNKDSKKEMFSYLISFIQQL